MSSFDACGESVMLLTNLLNNSMHAPRGWKGLNQLAIYTWSQRSLNSVVIFKLLSLADNYIIDLLFIKTLGYRFSAPFGLVIDPHAADPFMPTHPLDIIRQRRFRPIPTMFGFVKDEILFSGIGIQYSS
jgi:hypothetical protein